MDTYKQQLAKLRKEINEVDGKITKLIKERLKIVTKIGKLKLKHGIPITDTKREKEILAKVDKTIKHKGSAKMLKSIFKEFFKTTKKMQKK